MKKAEQSGEKKPVGSAAKLGLARYRTLDYYENAMVEKGADILIRKSQTPSRTRLRL